MKVKAPEKIYFDRESIESIPDDDPLFNYLPIKENDDDIEYIRADVFIEKACEYLMEYEFNDSPTIADRRKRVKDFKNYMKGE